ncbi:histidinol-phosphate transaminase [Tranquillimonas rosea]|uniref:histidinol-phosphate transaminase n=1 Tax=Tranquillimonas rosea TaxID=641238 RepID=UPI003BACE5F4
MTDFLRPELGALSPYNAGLTLDEVAARPGVTRIAKLGSNENPFGPPPEIAAAVSEAALNVYPDPVGRRLSARLAELHGVAPGQVMLGNGSEDLLNVLARAVLRPGDRVVTLYPSFPLHEDYAAMMGARVERVPIGATGRIDVTALCEAVAAPARLVVFSNPMNPVGAFLSPDALDEVMSAVHPDTVVCLDEAYHEYAAGPDYGTGDPYLDRHAGPLLILRTFSKAWGLAGLRVGYGVTNSADLRRGMDLVRTPFNVNAPAQAAGLAALDHPEAVERTVGVVREERARVAAALTEQVLAVLPSGGNFLFFDLGVPAAPVAERLLDYGVIVKAWGQPGWETWMRVSIGRPEDNDQFLEALAAVL